MRKAATVTDWLVRMLTLFAAAMGVVTVAAAQTAAAPAASVLFLLSLMAILVLLRVSRRCPACGDGRFPREPSQGVYRCEACGERFRRVRQGQVTWLARAERSRAAGVPRTRASASAHYGDWELVPFEMDDRWKWIGVFLPRLRELRRQLRPLADTPAYVLNLLYSVPVATQPPKPYPIQKPVDRAPATPCRARLRQALARACVVVALGAAIVALAPGLTRLHALDAVYFFIVLFAIGTCGLLALVLGRVLRLTDTATLALLAVDLALKALHLAAIGRWPYVQVLGTIAVAFPLTPLLLSALFRRWRIVEEAPGEFATGRLLRNKQARALELRARRFG